MQNRYLLGCTQFQRSRFPARVPPPSSPRAAVANSRGRRTRGQCFELASTPFRRSRVRGRPTTRKVSRHAIIRCRSPLSWEGLLSPNRPSPGPSLPPSLSPQTPIQNPCRSLTLRAILSHLNKHTGADRSSTHGSYRKVTPPPCFPLRPHRGIHFFTATFGGYTVSKRTNTGSASKR